MFWLRRPNCILHRLSKGRCCQPSIHFGGLWQTWAARFQAEGRLSRQIPLRENLSCQGGRL